MALNDPYAGSTSRAPRIRVLIASDPTSPSVPLTPAQQELQDAEADIESRHPELRTQTPTSPGVPLTPAQQELQDAEADIESRHPELRSLPPLSPPPRSSSEIPGVVHAEIVNNNYFTADKFTVQFALNFDPDFGMKFWGSRQPQMLLDFQLSLDGGRSWKSMLIGQVDHMSVDPVAGVCNIDGRDLTAYFIDTKTQESYTNKTASEVIQIIAAKHNMIADVTPTEVKVGRYYGAEHEKFTVDQFARVTTEWNLMCSLAQNEKYDIWVTGKTVHFHPFTPLDNNPYLVIWQGADDKQAAWSNVSALHMERSMYMAKDIIVVVRSYSSKNGKAVTKFSPTGARQSAVSSGKAQEFAFVRPNMTAAQAQAEANSIRENLTKQERLISFTATADLSLHARNMVRVVGTGSSWDQPYYIDSITRHIGWDGGLTMDVHAKNHSPESSVLPTA